MTLGGSAKVSGIGLGLRAPLADAILTRPPPALRWLEISPENYMARGGAFVRHLDALRERFPIVTHGLTLCPGGVEPLDDAYLSTLSKFVNRVASPWHSDHLCFGSHGGRFLHDLLPLPFTHAAAEHTAARLIEAQRRSSSRLLRATSSRRCARPVARSARPSATRSKVTAWRWTTASTRASRGSSATSSSGG